MDPFWIIPTVMTVAGFTLLILAIRQVGDSADALRRQFDQLGELQTAVSRLRAEADTRRNG